MLTTEKMTIGGATPSLMELAARVTDITQEISKYFELHNIQPPSFAPDSNDPPTSLKYVALQTSLKTCLEDLTLLVDGPKRSMRTLICQANDLAAFQIAFDFGFFNFIPLDGAISLQDLANRAGIDLDRTARCVRILATHRVFHEIEPNIIAHTAASAIFCRDEEILCAGQYMLDELFKASTATSECFKLHPHRSDAEHSAFYTRHGATMFKYYDMNPPHAIRFAKAMTGATKFTDRRTTELRDLFHWGALKGTVVDVGGGSGHVSIELAKVFPHLNFVVQDASLDMLAQGKPLLTDAPARNIAAFFIRQCIHNLCDRDVIRVFKALVPGLEGSDSGTPLLINDTVMPEPGVWPAHIERELRQMDMLMMIALGAKQRTQAEFEELLRLADTRYQLINCHTQEQMGLLEVHLKI
ncbi:hypothetical protein GQX73_g9838 [Xylaria multiplex]|uniref:O-methyltransferase C-terminal domain-containing protein n=1 Tax=Xylaria multiplex TaxID=323545 RepID=A0A7C8IHD0_9PEZI|nr:hypothetical protein GQX73_g9838 [Xylaria multiplex]